ncbi:MAG: ferrous iron transport protein A [Thermanaeromonas sp.]|uniref:FeoA family protein n=1 Tax=Thermanaeromonas sp. TaxID=2003697 RepID=UPI00243E2BD1|nr:FeoA family protein [Thermanaeromonas sp.]MCG0278487.1 ferrous iron transport protein A [Thermanaeromonas sp.]
MAGNTGFRDKACSLAELPERTRGTVVKVSGNGFWHRRLLELGFTPGTVVEVVRASLTGDPVAYRVKGTTVALRREQASLVFVQPFYSLS